MKWKDKTRGGHPVRIYAEDGAGEYSIHGAINYGTGFYLAQWMRTGEHVAESTSAYDLIPDTPIIDWSKQPDWCKAVAMDCYRRWIRCDGVPQQKGSEGLWSGVGVFIQPMHRSEYPVFDGHWTDSLCVRPEGGAQ